jgi:hypothetical protein
MLMTIAEAVVCDATKRVLRPGTNRLLKEVITNKHYLALLRFFTMHPSGRFAYSIVIQAMDDDGTQIEMEDTLDMLVSDGVVDTSIENGICYYQLTHEEPTRHLVINLAEFDWHQFQRLEHYYVAERQVPDYVLP